MNLTYNALGVLFLFAAVVLILAGIVLAVESSAIWGAIIATNGIVCGINGLTVMRSTR